MSEHGTAPWWDAERARAVCDRTTGVGADGLLLATLGSEVSMTLYNADGSAAVDVGQRHSLPRRRRSPHDGTAPWDTLEVHTIAGVRTVTLEDGRHLRLRQCGMGDVTFGETLAGTLGVAYVGNPHVVVRDDPSGPTRCDQNSPKNSPSTSTASTSNS